MAYLEREFLETKITLSGEHREYPCIPISISTGEAVVLYILSKEGKVGHLILPAGTLSVGYFWADRPYNAYHWVTPAGNSLGLYLNISDSTVIKDHQVIWRDLVVDILITPDGRYRVLDEDELPQDIDPVLSAKIKRIRDELLASYETILREIEQCSLNFLSKKIGYL